MSLNIFVAGRQLSLLAGTTLSLEYLSPLFQDEVFGGTYSYSFSLPLDETNRAIFGYPDVIESMADLSRSFSPCDVEWQGYGIGREGELRIRRVRPGRVEAQVLFGLSRVVTALKERKLYEYEFGGLRSADDQVAADGTLIPGLLLLANSTVADPDSSDFVFAPFLNMARLEPLHGLPAARRSVNGWVFSDVALFGAPAGGSFAASLNYVVPGSISPTPQPLELSPLPWLGYVVRTMLAELGARPGIDALTGELARLVLLSDAPAVGEFSLANSMPAATGIELLTALRTTIGLVSDINSRGEYELELLADLLADYTYDDWTGLATPDFDEREIPDRHGLHLVYTLPPDDATSSSFFAPPDNLPRGDEVATVEDLPAPTVYDQLNLPVPHVRWVAAAQRLYRSTVTVDQQAQTVSVSWAPHSAEYPAVDVAGGGEEYPQGIVATAVDVLPSQLYLSVQEDALMAAFSQPPYYAGRPDAERPTGIRLAFYRGRQPYLIGADHPLANLEPTYPLLTPFHLNALGDTVGDYSLQLHGPAGTVATLLGRWLEYVSTATPTKWRVWLTPAQLANLQLKRRKRIAGNEYFVRKISLSVPLTGPAIVELLPIPTSLGR